jgi:hypothetical protein
VTVTATVSEASVTIDDIVYSGELGITVTVGGEPSTEIEGGR